MNDEDKDGQMTINIHTCPLNESDHVNAVLAIHATRESVSVLCLLILQNHQLINRIKPCSVC